MPKSGSSGDVKASQWKFYEALSFLQKHIIRKDKTTTNLSLAPEVSSADAADCNTGNTDSQLDTLNPPSSPVAVPVITPAPKMDVSNKTASKRKRQADDTDSELQRSLGAISSYFSARSAAMSRTTNDEDDDDDVFGKLVKVELKKIKNPTIKRKVKKQINDALYDGQSADTENETRQSEAATFYAVNADGTLMEICNPLTKAEF